MHLIKVILKNTLSHPKYDGVIIFKPPDDKIGTRHD